MYIRNSVLNISEHFRVHKLLRGNNIPYVILKGIASGLYYPDYIVRACGDVDFLVKKDDYERAAALLEAEGFHLVLEHDKHKEYSNGGIPYELHCDIVGVPDTDIKGVFDQFFSDIIEKASEFKHGDSVCMIPSDIHHAVILLLHKAEHLRRDGIGLRHLCDWAAFVSSMSDDFFIEELQPCLKEMGLWQFALIMTDLCTEYLGLRKCQWAGRTDPEYLYRVMNDILSSGEFGNKNAAAETIARRHASHGVIHGEKGFVRVFFNMMSDSAKAAFPIAERLPVLLPAAYLYVSLRHVIRLVTGRRSLSGTANLLRESGEHRAIFDEWRLFEKESQ